MGEPPSIDEPLACMICGKNGDNITSDDYIFDTEETWIYCKPCNEWTCFGGNQDVNHVYE